METNNLILKGLITVTYGLVMFMSPTNLATIAMKEFFELEKLYEELKKTSVIDDLTGAYNRNFLQKAIFITASNAIHSQRSLICFIVDVDLLKKINDTYGHYVGDLALEATAKRLREVFWGSDFILRIGGDEFEVLADTNNLEAFHTKMDELSTPIKVKFMHKAPNDEQEKEIEVTFSVGFAEFHFSEMLPAAMFSEEYAKIMHEMLYRAADAKQYAIKTRKKALR